MHLATIGQIPSQKSVDAQDRDDCPALMNKIPDTSEQMSHNLSQRPSGVAPKAAAATCAKREHSNRLLLLPKQTRHLYAISNTLRMRGHNDAARYSRSASCPWHNRTRDVKNWWRVAGVAETSCWCWAGDKKRHTWLHCLPQLCLHLTRPQTAAKVSVLNLISARSATQRVCFQQDHAHDNRC